MWYLDFDVVCNVCFVCLFFDEWDFTLFYNSENAALPGKSLATLFLTWWRLPPVD